MLIKKKKSIKNILNKITQDNSYKNRPAAKVSGTILHFVCSSLKDGNQGLRSCFLSHYRIITFFSIFAPSKKNYKLKIS